MPFVDLPAYLIVISKITAARSTGIQMYLCRDGTSLETFVVLPERDAPKLSDSVNSRRKLVIYMLETQ